MGSQRNGGRLKRIQQEKLIGTSRPMECQSSLSFASGVFARRDDWEPKVIMSYPQTRLISDGVLGRLLPQPLLELLQPGRVLCRYPQLVLFTLAVSSLCLSDTGIHSTLIATENRVRSLLVSNLSTALLAYSYLAHRPPPRLMRLQW